MSSLSALCMISGLIWPHVDIDFSLKFPIDVERGSFMHDMAITENYAIFLDLPMVLKTDNMVKGIFPIVFDDTLGAR